MPYYFEFSKRDKATKTFYPSYVSLPMITPLLGKSCLKLQFVQEFLSTFKLVYNSVVLS